MEGFRRRSPFQGKWVPCNSIKRIASTPRAPLEVVDTKVVVILDDQWHTNLWNTSANWNLSNRCSHQVTKLRAKSDWGWIKPLLDYKQRLDEGLKGHKLGQKGKMATSHIVITQSRWKIHSKFAIQFNWKWTEIGRLQDKDCATVFQLARSTCIGSKVFHIFARICGSN